MLAATCARVEAIGREVGGREGGRLVGVAGTYPLSYLLPHIPTPLLYMPTRGREARRHSWYLPPTP
eukprot:1040090-Rhodomonas_salina.1